MELLDLLGQDGPPSPTKDADIGPGLGQQIAHVLQVLDMTSLIRGHCNPLRVFLNGTIDDLGHRPVVP